MSSPVAYVSAFLAQVQEFRPQPSEFNPFFDGLPSAGQPHAGTAKVSVVVTKGSDSRWAHTIYNFMYCICILEYCQAKGNEICLQVWVCLNFVCLPCDSLI